MNYDYEAKGRADFLAGKKDERLYGLGDLVPGHGAAYRRGWQGARRDAEDGDKSPKAEQAPPTPLKSEPPVITRTEATSPEIGVNPSDAAPAGQLDLFS